MNKISMLQTCLCNISYKKVLDFTTTSRYRGNSAIVHHNTSFIVHSRVTVGDCLVECEHKLPCQFARVVAHRMLYTLLALLHTECCILCSWCCAQNAVYFVHVVAHRMLYTLLALLRTDCCIPAFYLFVRHAAQPHKVFLKNKFQVYHSLLAKLLGPVFWVEWPRWWFYTIEGTTKW